METEKLNIHQKLLKIANMAGVLRKNKTGYNYKYVTEDEIQAKITAGLQKYKVTLLPSIRENTLKVIPYHYVKFDKKEKKDINIDENIVMCEVDYTWTNAEKPEEKITCGWGFVGQMEDASQAFGAGATYGNRYYLIKALQLATVEDDPDNYRSKQKAAEYFEEEQQKKLLKDVIEKIIVKSQQLIAQKKATRQDLIELIAKSNNGEGNPNTIKDLEIANKILEELNGEIKL